MNPFLGIALYSLMNALEFFQKGEERHRLGATILMDLSVEYTLKAKLYQLSPAEFIEKQQDRLDFAEAMNQLKSNNIAVRDDEKVYLWKVHNVQNFAQHRGAIPDSLSKCEYLKWVCSFINRFALESFDLDIGSVLPSDLRETMLELTKD